MQHEDLFAGAAIALLAVALGDGELDEVEFDEVDDGHEVRVYAPSYRKPYVYRRFEWTMDSWPETNFQHLIRPV